MFLEHLGFLLGRVFVLESEEGSACGKIHLLNLIGGLGGAQSHEGVDVHVIGGREEGEEGVVTECVDVIPIPLVLSSEDLLESLG